MEMRIGEPRINALTDRIIGMCIDVHRELGPGLLESAYEECVCHLLSAARVKYERQLTVPVQFRGLRLDAAYRLDLVVESTVVVEFKAIEMIAPIHKAQLLTYLKLSGYPLGLLVNFNVPMLRTGIRRIVWQPELNQPKDLRFSAAPR